MRIRRVTAYLARRRKRGTTLVFDAANLLLLIALIGVGNARAEPSNAVVFMYHRFGEAAYPSTSVRLDQFDVHLQHLAVAGYRIWPLQRIVDLLRSGQTIPDRTVAITVDDAYLSVYKQAWPRLKQRGWPFTVFVSTDAIDEGLPAFMNWEQMREMQRNGVVFANHSASHDYLIRHNAGEDAAAWRKRVTADIMRAQDRLKQELGDAPLLFAYPYGEYSSALASLVGELGFVVAFGQHSGAIGPLSDLRALPRYPMAEAYADSAEFNAKAASLALPVREVEPWDPVIGAVSPLMTATLATGDARLSALSCFDNHGEKIDLKWIRQDSKTAVFTARARGESPTGRSRYNCTAPSVTQPDRYYWFSHPWIRLGGRPDADLSPPSGDRSRADPRRAPP